MSPSLAEPGESLLLDFGDPKYNTLVGKSYGMHQIIFIMTTRFNTPQYIPQWFEKPSEYDQWDFPAMVELFTFCHRNRRSSDFRR